MTEDAIRELVGRLLVASTFEDAAELALRVILEQADAALKASPWRKNGTILRAMAHLRPGGDYRGLVVLERGKSSARAPQDGALMLPSATAWQWVSRRKRPVAVDVVSSRLQVIGGESVDGVFKAEEKPFASADTVQRFMAREASHVYAVPLRAPGGVVLGMVSVEANCLAAVERPFLWAECGETIQLVADLAAPALSTLPSRVQELRRDDPLLPVVGRAMAGLINLLGVFTRQEETLLITGPTGAGKTRLAQWCHAQSLRSAGPFQAVDLLTVPEDMQMAELFGWRKGAFTGATRDASGCVARAEGGTLFIDEIDKLSMKAQAGLLQLMETRTWRVLGDPGTVQRANVRFIVGTNADLAQVVAQGRFREDLYYRIHVLPVKLPALADRADEIPAWAAYMATRRHKEAGGKDRAELGADAAVVLAQYPWPGNLRQLDNVIRRAYAVALAELGAFPDALTLTARHVERALAFERRATESAGGVLPTLRAASRAWMDEVNARRERGETLDPDHAEALRGLIFLEALERLGDVKAVFRAFGKERLVETRNHQQTWKRELKKLADLYQALGEPLDPALAAQLEG